MLQDNTYTIISKIAYLLGVPQRIFENMGEPPQRDWYDQLNADKNAQIILILGEIDCTNIVSSVPDVSFLSLQGKGCDPNFRKRLVKAGIACCDLDDFQVGSNEDVKSRAVLAEIQYLLDEAVDININDMLRNACIAIRADIEASARQKLLEQDINSMQLVIESDGNLRIWLGYATNK